MSTITVLYTCADCGLTDQEVTVPARKRTAEFTQWLKKTCIPAVQRHHRAHDPTCVVGFLDDVKVPYATDGEPGCADIVH